MSIEKNTKNLLEAMTKSIQNENSDEKIKKYRYVIYARKSTDDNEKQARSLGDQIIECQKLAENNDLIIVPSGIIRESESAKEPDTRPKFREMIENIKRGKYDGIIAWHPDRLARNMKDAGEMIDLIDKGIIKSMKFVSFTFENTPSGKMLLGITFVLSKQYSDQLSDNVARGNKHSIEEGKYINRAKHGYYKDSEQHLHPDGNNFLLIKKVFSMRLEGKTLEEIAEYMNKNNYQRWNKNGIHTLFKMQKQRLVDILNDTFYAGVIVYGKKSGAVDLTTIYDFQAAVTVQDFMEINKIDNKTDLFKLARRYFKGDAVKSDLMRGMVICADCGEPMVTGITAKKMKKGLVNYFYFRCDSDECIRYGKSVRAQIILDYINSFLEKKPFSSQKSYQHYVEEMKRVSQQRSMESRKKLLALQTEKGRAGERLLKIKEFLIGDNDSATKKAFEVDLANAQANLERLEKAIVDAQRIIKVSKPAIVTYDRFIELMENMPLLLAKIPNMKELDQMIRKIFLNFSVRGKNVEKSTLSAPFDTLCDPNVSNCAGERT